MAEKRSCCCGALPAMWWWLLTLLGLPLIFFLMISAREGVIENDLASRTTDGLKAASMDWAKANIDKRGRDLQLLGVAASEEERDAAFKLAQGIEGVREVQNLIEVVPFNNPDFAMQLEAGKVLLQGTLASQDEIDQVVSAAEGLYGAGQVDNRLSLGERIANAGWLGGLSQLLPSLKGLENAGLNVSAEGGRLSGTVYSDADKTSLLAQARELLGDKLEDGLIVKTLSTADLKAVLKDGKLQLDGNLASQEEIDALVAAAGKRVKPADVINKLNANKDFAKADWLNSAMGALALLTDDNGSLRIADGKQMISGLVYSDADKTALVGQAKQLLGDSLQEQIVVKTLTPAAMQATLDKGRLTLNGTLSTEQQVNALLAAAGKRVGADNVINQLKVSKDYAVASWLNSAQKLFGLLPDKMGKFTIADGVLEMSGELDSDSNHDRMVASVNQALAGAGLNLVDGMTVKAPPPPPEPEPVVVAVTEPAPAAPAPAPEPELTEAEQAANLCQQQLNDEMHDQSVHFETNKAVIKQDSIALLDSLAKIVIDCSGVLAGRSIEVSGHTDSDGAEDYNLDLSQRRADAIKDYFGKVGVDTGLIQSVGYGETQPVASNDTEEGRAQNRRISFKIK